MKQIAIQGEVESFHHQAARAFFGDDTKLVHCHNFREVFETLMSGAADHAVVAVENSLYGSLNEVHDLMSKHKAWIVGEVYLRIEFCLIGLPGAKLEEITEVHSQVFALSECEDYLDSVLPQAKRFEEHDTAGSVGLIKEWNDPTKAAIASRDAAKHHGLEVLASNIETHHENYTRFAVLAPQKEQVDGANKTSLVLTTRDDTKPGALLRALQVFAERNINMTMLQSRPILGKAWHYLFYIDVEFGTEDAQYEDVMNKLYEAGCQVQVLGSYKANKI